MSCLNRRDYSKGIQYALQHSSIRPRDVRVHELLAQLYEGKKDWKKAIESYKMAIQMDPQKSKLGLKGIKHHVASKKKNSQILLHVDTSV